MAASRVALARTKRTLEHARVRQEVRMASAWWALLRRTSCPVEGPVQVLNSDEEYQSTTLGGKCDDDGH